MIRATGRSLAALLLFAASPPALAQTGPGSSPPPPAAPSAPAAPPPPYGGPGYPYGSPGYAPAPTFEAPIPPPLYSPTTQRPGAHLHDGFYLRMGLGIVVHHSKLTIPGGGGSNGTTTPIAQTLTGTGLAVDFAVGGVVADGLVIAGDLGAQSLKPKTDLGSPGDAALDRVSASRLGVLADWYADPTGGFHVQGGLGLAGYSYHRTVATDYDTKASMNGLAWNLGVGWEGWVGRDWGLGALLRLDGMSLKRSDTGNEASATLLAPSLLFTATYN